MLNAVFVPKVFINPDLKSISVEDGNIRATLMFITIHSNILFKRYCLLM